LEGLSPSIVGIERVNDAGGKKKNGGYGVEFCDLAG